VVVADLDDYDTVRAALGGAHGAFFVTNFWEHFSPEKEVLQARTLAAAAKDAGVAHVIWSTLEDTRRWVDLADDRMPTLGGKYKVPHFDAKGEADAIFRENGVPTTFLLTSFYWDNLLHFGMHPQRGEDGNLTFVLPMGEKKLPGMAVEDIGRSAYGIFKGGAEFIGRTVGIAGEHLTGAEMAAALSDALGEPVHHFSPTFDMYRSFPFDGADDLGNMFQFKHDFNEAFRESRDVEATRRLNPQLQTFRAWLEANKEAMPSG